MSAREEPASEPMLELIGVRAAYGRIQVLHGVDLVVPRGSVVALLGPNGGGKTTTLKVASGQLVPTSGCVHLAGRHVNGVAPDALARIGVCTIPEGRGIFPNLTVRENLRMVTFSGAQPKEVEERAFTQFPRLGERRNQVAGTMSGGEQQMLAMARGLAVDPTLLFLDEL
jgi:branched-chain amino acid transport system ATP-binding protein